MGLPKVINVTCAIIEHGQKVLMTQRAEKMDLPLKWEFPGGKIEENEEPTSCIVREIAEELNVNITPIKKLPDSIHNYGSKSVRLIPFICTYTSGELTLNEHKNFMWVEPNQLKGHDWCEADLPIIDSYLDYLASNGRA